MRISPIPTLDPETNDIRLRTARIVGERIIPNENILRQRTPEARGLRRKLKSK